MTRPFGVCKYSEGRRDTLHHRAVRLQHAAVEAGHGVDVAKLPVTTIDARVAGDPGVAPGEKLGLNVSFSEANGSVRSAAAVVNEPGA